MEKKPSSFTREDMIREFQPGLDKLFGLPYPGTMTSEKTKGSAPKRRPKRTTRRQKQGLKIHWNFGTLNRARRGQAYCSRYIRNSDIYGHTTRVPSRVTCKSCINKAWRDIDKLARLTLEAD